MAQIKDLVGKVFGRLTVVSFSGRKVKGECQAKTYWNCTCECGTDKELDGGNLVSGAVMSCGCLRREVLDKTTHGLFHTTHYNVWSKLIQRCTDPSNKSYPDYGGRGIHVCERWLNLASFVADMGPRPEGASIDRIDNNGDYEPGNCRWATDVEQANNKRNNFVVTHAGKSLTVAQWARATGINPYTLYSRLTKLGMSAETALTLPVGKSNHAERKP